MSDNWNTLRSQLEYFAKPFPHEAIALANAHRAEVAPFLVEVLANVADDPAITEDGEYMLHQYAMHLLAAWREPRAYAPMAALGHHPEAAIEKMMGDTVTESYGRCLASVCDGNLQLLKDLFEDTQASHWARVAALNAWQVRVLEGDSAREDLLAYLIARGEAEAARLRLDGGCGLEVLDWIVSTATDISATEMQDLIAGWYDDNLLDSTIAGKKWVQKEIAQAFESKREQELRRGQGYIQDTVKEMSCWAAFAEEPAKKASYHHAPSPARQGPKIGRNDPCPCGSGKKYKKCHGANV
ncbi:MAG: DUF1186 domain-containing protein [Burkholderiales bacterium]|nr:DUF1186 domain-containing protein [Burkholderiales bacterium]